MTERRKILVTSALPYANGELHLGHLMEQIQTDIWVRFQRLRGHDCLYECADCAHDAAITLKAEELGISPEEHIQRMHEVHKRVSEGFLIQFDNFHTTHSTESRALGELIYQRLEATGHIAR